MTGVVSIVTGVTSGGDVSSGQISPKRRLRLFARGKVERFRSIHLVAQAIDLAAHANQLNFTQRPTTSAGNFSPDDHRAPPSEGRDFPQW